MGRDEIFGTSPDGEPVRRVTISGGSLTGHFLSWGAIIQDLRLDGHDAPLTLGFERFQDYLDWINYFGAVVGRHANRIRDGRFSIDGKAHQIDAARPETQGLHGGVAGYARRNWTISALGGDVVTLSLVDADGTMGFPGNVAAHCSYRLKAPGVLSVELTATTDKPTLCNLAQHAYFNLDDGGATDILGHRLMISAEAYLPVDDQLIPTGEVRSVDGSAHDFRRMRTILPPDRSTPVRYDENFCLAPSRGPLRQAAWAQGPKSGVEMEIWTTEPGLQFYAGQHLGSQVPGLGGRPYPPFGGFCLEAQTWPDSPNHADFPQATLRPGETYRQITEFRFRLG